MIYLWASLLCVVNAGWLSLTLLMLPGNWMMLATTMLAAWWLRGAGMFSPWTLVAIVALALIGELVEFFSSAVGVSKSGGTRWGGTGSLLGAVVGAIGGTLLIPVPLLGSLVGVCVGAAGGALAGELATGRSGSQSAKSATAAGAGRLVGTAVKFIIGVVIWSIIAIAAFWP